MNDNSPQSIITQVTPESQGASGSLMGQDGTYIDYEQYNDDDILIHLNMQENHYYITRDQLMSLPESLLLCLFPSGVFMDKEGQVITNLTPEDEVYIPGFSPACFEYIMQVYGEAQYDLLTFPVNEIFNRKEAGNLGSKFFNFGSASSSSSQESEVLHEKPGIIVLREDLDFYCVPQLDIDFKGELDEQAREVVLQSFMAQVKLAAGSRLLEQQSVFSGLQLSNRAKKSQKPGGGTKLGPAEQHLMDMLCSSGFETASTWGNRYQEEGKTVISSLSLCRLQNETTQSFREKVNKAKASLEDDQKSLGPSLTNELSSTNHPPSPHLTPTTSRTDVKRRSRLSVLTDNVRSRSASRNRSASKHTGNEPPTLYELVPKPEINTKLLLFWKKPARKCWWGQEKMDLQVEFPAEIVENMVKLSADSNESKNLTLSVTIHIRRVWTLELSIIGIR